MCQDIFLHTGESNDEWRGTIDESRMTIDPLEAERIKEFFLFYFLKKQSEATSTIRHSTIVNLHSIRPAAFQAGGWAEQRTAEPQNIE